MVEADLADHGFLDGRLILREPRRGHRSGTDAVLLAAASRLEPGQHLMDVGAGAGAAALAVLCRVTDATATLLERNPEMAALARHNIEVNGLAARADVIEADIFDKAHRGVVLRRPADVVISNPPFFLSGEVRISAVAQRAASHVLDGANHGDWFRTLLMFAKPHGRVVMIHRPDALPAIVEAANGRVGLRLRCVHPSQAKPASRILVEGRLGQRAPFVIEPILVLHEADQRFTAEAEALHRGQSWI